MGQKARVIIELVYDLDEFYGDDSATPGEELTPKEIHNDLEDRVYYDLTDLMRGDRLRSWSDIEIEEDEDLDKCRLGCVCDPKEKEDN